MRLRTRTENSGFESEGQSLYNYDSTIHNTSKLKSLWRLLWKFYHELLCAVLFKRRNPDFRKINYMLEETHDVWWWWWWWWVWDCGRNMILRCLLEYTKTHQYQYKLIQTNTSNTIKIKPYLTQKHLSFNFLIQYQSSQ